MRPLTEKQLAFAANKAAGMKHKEATIAAGYSPNAASVTASQLMQLPSIKAAIAKFKKEQKVSPQSDDDEIDPRQRLPKMKYEDAKEFLIDAMNHKHLPIAARADYAKALMPYQHARIGETGKKEKAKQNAVNQTKGPFASKAAPGARVALN